MEADWGPSETPLQARVVNAGSPGAAPAAVRKRCWTRDRSGGKPSAWPNTPPGVWWARRAQAPARQLPPSRCVTNGPTEDGNSAGCCGDASGGSVPLPARIRAEARSLALACERGVAIGGRACARILGQPQLAPEFAAPLLVGAEVGPPGSNHEGRRSTPGPRPAGRSAAGCRAEIRRVRRAGSNCTTFSARSQACRHSRGLLGATGAVRAG